MYGAQGVLAAAAMDAVEAGVEDWEFAEAAAEVEPVEVAAVGQAEAAEGEPAEAVAGGAAASDAVPSSGKQ